MIAGRLEIEIATGVARLQSDMTQARGIISNFARDAERMLGGVRTAFAALGVGLTTAGFAAFLKQAIDMNDRLNDLSKTTRIAAADLAGLRYAAAQTGGELDAVATSANKLGINIAKNGERFAALGVTARDPIEAMKQLADATNAIADPQLRAAVLSDALGKSWERVAPLLSEGSQKIGQMVEEGKRLSGVTEELVRQSDEFNDNLVKLGGNGGGVNAVLVQLLPLLNATAEGLLSGGKNMTLWSAAGTALAEVLRVIVVLGGNVAFVIRAIGTEIGGLAAQAAAVATGDFARAAEIGRQMKKDAEANRVAFDAWETSILNVGAATRSTTAAIEAGDQVSRRAASDAAAQAREFLDHEERKRRAAREAEEAVRAAAKAARLAWDDEYDALKRLHDELEDAYETMRRMEKEFGPNIAKITEDIVEGIADSVGAAVDAGMKIYDAQLEMWSQLGRVAGDFFADLVMNGKSAFDNLKRWVKELLAQMIALFAKRWILNMAAGGSVWGAAGQALAGGGSDGSMAGNVLSTGASVLGVGGSLGIGGAGVGASMWGAMGAGTAVTETGVVLATGSMAGTAVGTGVMGGVYTALAAIPVWGWIAMAVIAAIAFFSGKGGGPKTGGFFSSGGSSDRLFTPSQGDSAVRDVVLATVATYDSLVGRMGGTAASGLDFRLGFDHDPAGDAMSRVSAQLRGPGGALLYSNLDREMDDKEVPAAIALETKRLLLAALQATDFADEIDAIFDSATDIANMTGEAIDQVIARAREMFSVIQGLQGLGLRNFDVAALRTFALEGETIGQTFERIAGAWMGLVDAFTSDEVKLQNARRALEESGIALPATRDGWLDMMRALDMSTESGRTMFATMMNLSGAFDLVTSAAAAMSAEWADLQDILNRYNGGTDLTNAVGRFQAGNAWARGMSPEQLIAALRTITAEDFGNYSSANRALINSILSLGLNIQGLDRTIQVSGPSASTIFGGDLTNANVRPGPTWEWNGSMWVNGAAGAGGGGGSGLGDYLNSLLLGSLSTLDPMQKLAEARKQYETMLGSDNDAGLQQAHRAYIDIARSMFGSSSAFVEIFNSTFDQIAGRAGEPSINARSLEVQQGMATSLVDVRMLLTRMLDKMDSGTAVMAEASYESGEKVASAVQNASLPTVRR